MCAYETPNAQHKNHFTRSIWRVRTGSGALFESFRPHLSFASWLEEGARLEWNKTVDMCVPPPTEPFHDTPGVLVMCKRPEPDRAKLTRAKCGGADF